MQISIALLTLAASAAQSLAEAFLENGYYYRNEVKGIQYTNVGFSGQYQEVTFMDKNNGQCPRKSVQFSGSLAPLHEELSLHFRGPLKLRKFAAYTPTRSLNSKREIRKRIVTLYETVWITVLVGEDGKILSTENSQPQATEKPEPQSSEKSKTEPQPSEQPKHEPQSSEQPKPEPQSSEKSTPKPQSSEQPKPQPSEQPKSQADRQQQSGSGWARGSYYDSGSGARDNLVFLNNLGDNVNSGVWDYTFGGSLAYATSDMKGAAKKPQTPQDRVISSKEEFSIWTAQPCKDNNCGYFRPGIPALHGFGGREKMFLMRFEMPAETQGSPSDFNYDMPAIWALNAKIPRTQQYGACSCWNTGCGELDLFEVLNSGNQKMISHVHTGQGAPESTPQGGGGSPDYFKRPSGSYMDAAVIMKDGKIRILDITSKKIDFSSNLNAATVDSWHADSTFNLP